MKKKLVSFGIVALMVFAGWFLFLRDRKSAFMKCYESTGWVELGNTTQPTCGGHTATAEDVKQIYSN